MSELHVLDGKVMGGLPVPLENFRLLWSNPNPNVDFDSQTINLIDNDYDVAVIEYYYNRSIKRASSVIIEKNLNGIITLSVTNGSTNEFTTTCVRTFNSVSEGSQILFNTANTQHSNGLRSDDNSYIIPYKIYGIKKDSASGSSQGQVKTTIVTGTTDANANIPLRGWSADRFTVLSAYGPGEDSSGDLINGLPMASTTKQLWLHVTDWAGNARPSANVSLRVSYIEM